MDGVLLVSKVRTLLLSHNLYLSRLMRRSFGAGRVFRSPSVVMDFKFNGCFNVGFWILVLAALWRGRTFSGPLQSQSARSLSDRTFDALLRLSAQGLRRLPSSLRQVHWVEPQGTNTHLLWTISGPPCLVCTTPPFIALYWLTSF